MRNTGERRTRFCYISNKAAIGMSALIAGTLIAFIILNQTSAGETMLTTGRNQTSCDALALLNHTNVWPSNESVPHWFVANLAAVCNALKELSYETKNGNIPVTACKNIFFNSPKSPIALPSSVSPEMSDLFWYCSRGLFQPPTDSIIFLTTAFTLTISTVLFLALLCAQRCVGDAINDNESNWLISALAFAS